MSLAKLSFATAASFLTIKFYIIYERWVFCLQMLAVVTQVYVTSNERWHLCLWCLEILSLLQDLQHFTICSTIYFLKTFLELYSWKWEKKSFFCFFFPSCLDFLVPCFLRSFTVHCIPCFIVLFFFPFLYMYFCKTIAKSEY